MKRSIITITLLILFHLVNAQQFSRETGEYTNDEINLKSCSFEPTAGAIVLHDIGKSHFINADNGYLARSIEGEKGLLLIFERRIKIKVFNESGLDAAIIAVPIYNDGDLIEEITSIKSKIYNLQDSKVITTSVDLVEISTEVKDQHWQVKKFKVPNVVAGSVFEVSYALKSPYFFNLRDWDFQREIPVVYSEYTTVINPQFEYLWYLQGGRKLDEHKSFREIEQVTNITSVGTRDKLGYFFVMKNIPSFKKDEYMTTEEDYKIKINFQLSAFETSKGAMRKYLTTWPELNRELLQHNDFGGYLKSSQKKAIELMPSINLDFKSQVEKAISIRNYITSNFRYDGTDGRFASKNIKDFISLKTGNAANINLFFVSLLNEAGIDAKPLMISTRDNGKIKVDYPIVDVFNYVLVSAMIDGKATILDATDPMADYNEIPPRCISETGLVVEKNAGNWLNFKSQVSSGILYKFDLTPDVSSKQLAGKISMIATGYDAFMSRKMYANNREELLTNLKIDKDAILTSTNTEQIGKPFELAFEESIPLAIEKDQIIIYPFTNKPISQNPFTQQNRNYPIDFKYSQRNTFESTIHIPAGYKMFSRPEDLTVENQLIDLIYSVDTSTPGIIKVKGNYMFKKDSYPASEYERVKVLYNMIVKKFNEKFVFIPDSTI